ncbi:MAG TPA: DUF2520 domain-containing protein, partial [Candidatus Polarisedimenticolia bacterium]|nr:DUF2520 domain-containing protein [Candidatus Polarisedimenticolia bacterium]
LRSAAPGGPRRGLTGPAARGDSGTIALHLEALASEPRASRELYRALACRMVAMAEAQRRLPPQRARRLRRQLGCPRD